MLDLLRRKAQSPYIQATILIIILVFVFWGVRTNDDTGPTDVATVNDQAITYREFQQTYERTVDQYRDKLGGNLSDDLLKALNLRQQVLNQFIDRTLLLQGAAAMGLMVSDEEVRRTIQTMPSFQNNGAFDVARYEELLAGSRLTPAGFEASIRTDLLTDKVAKALSRFSRVTPDEVRKRFIYDYETFTLDYLPFAAAEFTGAVTVNDEKLATFFAAAKENYKTAPQIKLQYLFFPAGEGAPVPTDQEIAAYYDQHQADFQVAEQRHARHILLRVAAEDSAEKRGAVRKRLQEILAQARGGKDFAALAREFSQDGSAASGGDLGFFGRGQMVPPFEEAAFALKPGAISEVVTTDFGFHILKLEAVNPAHQRSLAEARPEIIAKLTTAQGGAVAFKRAGEAYEQIILAGSLANYAKKSNITVKSTGFFTRETPPAELTARKAMLTTAFTLKKGELSSLVDDHDGYAILFVEDTKEPEVPPFAAVRARVTADFTAKEAERLATEAAQTLLTALRKGGSLEEEAQKLGRAIRRAQPFSRSDRAGNELPAEVLDQGITLTAAAPWPEKVVASGSTHYVLRLAQRQEPAADQLAAKEEEVRKRLDQDQRTALFTAWLQSLKSKAKISINQKMLE
ncbi:MAG: SurA N-terminal domain-containing protein [Desulfobulbaceae bacterium]|nr:SurA N-terminal domain-containing protein [Desulfobulbaceae bacterium]